MSVHTKKLGSYRTFDIVANLIPIMLFIISIIFISSKNEYFLTMKNLISILLQTSSLALMAIGMTFVLIVGGIDLSIPPVMALSAILGVMYMKGGGDAFTAALIMLCAGILIGALNGFAIAYFNMIPFVVTLSMQIIVYGFCLWITQATGVAGINPAFQKIVLYKVGIIPMPIIVMITIMIIAEIFMKKSYMGRWLYLTGNNIKLAQICGVPEKKVVFTAYLISGIMASLAGMVLSARMGAASPTFGEDTVVTDIVCAAVIGGASTSGGVGRATGAVFGAIFITIISNAANMLHISYNMMLFIKGILIISFVALDMWKRKRRS